MNGRWRYLLATVFMMVALEPSRADEVKACAKPGLQPMQPLMETHTQPPYPEASVLTQEDGTTLLQIKIDAQGVPADAWVVTSSGSLRLDEAARDHVKNVWRWKPAMKDCQPVAIETRISVRWDLREAPSKPEQMMPVVQMVKADYPPEALARAEQGWTVISLVVTATGATVRAQVAQSSGFADLDAKSQQIAQTRYHWGPATQDGKPINTQVLVAFHWELDQAQAAPAH